MDNECELDTDVNIKLEFTDLCKDIMFNVINQRSVSCIWLACITGIASF